MAEALSEFREALEALFTAPFASRRWASAAGRSHWAELEGWQDSMAGLLSSITRHGGCEYVYSREDWCFAGVNDPPALRARLLEWHTGLAGGVERFAPATSEEAADLAFMQSVVGGMRELIERACVVEQARWEAARRAEPKVAPDCGGIK